MRASEVGRLVPREESSSPLEVETKEKATLVLPFPWAGLSILVGVFSDFMYGRFLVVKI